MTPFLLFEYILAVLCGVGFSALLIMWVLAMMVNWDKYNALRAKCKGPTDKSKQ
jgi:hypothetical protein